MLTLAELLKSERYPGRFLVVGKDGDAYVLLYGATGRSPSSLARRFVREGNGIYMGGIDDTVAREGNPELLEYPALVFFDNGIAVANGRQIEKISSLDNRDARQQLSYMLSDEAYEPDENKTPRITGCLVKTSRGMDAAIHIARYASDGIDLSSWSVPLTDGEGMFISTYTGDDARPAPSFKGEPIPVSLHFGSAKKAAQTMRDALKPKWKEPDYRVAFFAVYVREDKPADVAILNQQ